MMQTILHGRTTNTTPGEVVVPLNRDHDVRTILIAGTMDGATVSLNTKCPVTNEYLVLDGCSWTTKGCYALDLPQGLKEIEAVVAAAGASTNLTVTLA